MTHHNTVFAQMLKFIPTCLSRQGHEFESLANQHHSGRRLRKMTRWTQFVAMATAQLSGRHSLRDVVSNMAAQARKLYHLGMSAVSRSSLSRVNASQPYELYEALFAKLPACCRQARSLSSQGAEARLLSLSKHRFKNKHYSLDASTIDLCLKVFPWAKFRDMLRQAQQPPGAPSNSMSGWITRAYCRPACSRQAFVAITEGKTHDLSAARTLRLPKGSIVVMDRGYNDDAWYNQLHNNDISFVTRLKTNARYRVIERRAVLKNKGLTCDQTIQLTGAKAKNGPIRLRRIGYKDAKTGIHYIFLTNHFKLAARTIADIYKARWQVELFFKWSKQNLKVKSFLGASKNAVLTQIGIAMCVYLLLSYIKFLNPLQLSLQQMLRLLQLNLFERRDLLELLRGDPPEPPVSPNQAALVFS